MKSYTVTGQIWNGDSYCVQCADRYFTPDQNMDSYPLFADSESDFIHCCDMCGELLDHQLTEDEDQYRAVVSIMVKYEPDKSITVEYFPYNGIARRYKNVSMASLGRLTRYVIANRKAIPESPAARLYHVLWYTIRHGIDRR